MTDTSSTSDLPQEQKQTAEVAKASVEVAKDVVEVAKDVVEVAKDVVEVAKDVVEVAPGLFAQLKETGETGKRQWEESLAQAKEFLGRSREEQREELHRGLERLQQRAQEPWSRVQEQGRSVLRYGPVASAQERGTDLLLRLVSSLRQGMQTVEANLQKTHDEAEAKPAEAAATA